MKGGTQEHRQKNEASLHVLWGVKLCNFGIIMRWKRKKMKEGRKKH